MKKIAGLPFLVLAGLVVLLAGTVIFGALQGNQLNSEPGAEALASGPSQLSSQKGPVAVSDAPATSGAASAAAENEETAQMQEEDTITRITLSQNGSTVKGAGARVSENIIRISQGGSYRLEGTLENGQIYVEAKNSETVELILAGVSITNRSEAAIQVENAGQTMIVLEEGTENSLQSGQTAETSSVDDQVDQKLSGAALYARDNLSITGTGSLQVYGYINNGIHTTNRLRIDDGNITVRAKNNGIKGKDSVEITSGDFSIVSGGDGIKSDDSSGEGYGTVSITGGTFSIQSESDGVQAETVLEISGGEFDVTTANGSENVAFSSETGWGAPDTNWDISGESETSTKSFKSGTELRVTGGRFSVNSRDDAFHSNGTVLISGGDFQIASGDDGIHGDTDLTIESGTIQIRRSYEGIEANRILIRGGEISVYASDDGLNAYGGQGRRGWGGSGKQTDEMPLLHITGGTVRINAEGDGVDSNGDILVEGGLLVVDGPSSSWNGAIDSGTENGGSCVIHGGTVLAIGSSGMAETFDRSSRQPSFRHNLAASFSSGDEIRIADQAGNELYRHSAAKSGNSVVFSSPLLVVGETYLLSVNGERVEITMDSISASSGQRGGWGW